MVNLSHHLRRFLVALAVYVPQHQDGSSPGELLGKEPPETASSPGNDTHLSGHALFLRPHNPFSPGRHKSPEHLQNDHEELGDDDHHLQSQRDA